MAIISSVLGAEIVDNVPKYCNEDNITYKIYFGVFFDGTSNNAIQAKDARRFRKKHSKFIGDTKFGNQRHTYEVECLDQKDAKDIDKQKDHEYTPKEDNCKKEDNCEKIGYSNISILHSKYTGGINKKEIDDSNSKIKNIVYKIYVEGAGANDIKGFINGLPAVGLGFGLGKTGVVALVSKAIAAVHNQVNKFKDKKNIELHFDIFGFSRGAACARLFAYIVRRNQNDDKFESLYRESEFAKYYCKEIFKEGKLGFLDDFKYDQSPDKGKKTIDFLGIYDTVASIGILRRKKKDGESNDFFNLGENSINPLRIGFALNRDFDGNLHDLNVKEYGLYSPSVGGFPTFHICAMDEFRENFALTDIGKFSVNSKSLEIFMPGCHSDIGGGYICNNEERIVLNKFSLFSTDNIINKNKFGQNSNELDSCLKVCIDKPHHENPITSPLSIEAFKILGWLPGFSLYLKTKDYKEQSTLKGKKEFLEFDSSNDNELAYEGIVKNNVNRRRVTRERDLFKNKVNEKQKFGVGEYDYWESDARVGFKRTVPFFFSNVTLQLMAQKAFIETGRNMFMEPTQPASPPVPTQPASPPVPTLNTTDTWPNDFYNIPSEISYIYDSIKPLLYCNNERYWCYPGGSYNSLEYKMLRLKYLHFTSEQKLHYSRIWDVQNRVKETTNSNYTNLMTRIVYKGDKDESGKMYYYHTAYKNGDYKEITIEKFKEWSHFQIC